MDTAKEKAGAREPDSIDVRERQDLWYWSRELGLSIEQLQHVVEATGSSVANVREFLRKAGPAARQNKDKGSHALK